MTDFGSKIEDVTIDASSDTSRTVRWEEYQDAVGLMLFAPASVEAIDMVIEVCDDPDASAPQWRTFKEGSPPTDFVPPIDEDAFGTFTLPLAPAWRIKAASDVSAPHTWKVSKQFKA